MCCWLCRQSKSLINEWRAAPFAFLRVDRTHADFAPLAADYPMADAVLLERRRYCWAHAFSRLLTNILGYLVEQLAAANATTAAKRLQAAVAQHSSHSGWKSTSSLSIKQSKLLLESPVFHRFVADLFGESSLRLRICRPSSPDGTVFETLASESSHVTSLLLACIRVFKDFAYAPWPSRRSFVTLWRARNALLGVYAANCIPLAPTEHYLTSHAIELALYDRTAYVTVQESMEHKHKLDRNDAAHSAHNHMPTRNNHRTLFEQMLDHQELRRVLDVVDKIVDERDYAAERLTHIPMPIELEQWPELPWPSVLHSLFEQILEQQ